MLLLPLRETTVRMKEPQEMNKAKAFRNFLNQVNQFAQIVLVTDEEVRHLFGEEVTMAVAKLEHFSKEEQICSGCGGICCNDIGCEIYAPQFSQCPIYAYRPLVCRLHFCHRFDAMYRSMVIDLRDVFVDCFRAMNSQDNQKLRSLDSPPLGEACPEFITAVGPWVEAVRDGRLEPDHVIELICREAEKYRNACSCIIGAT